MVEIKKMKTEFGDNFKIIVDGEIFEIFFGGNLDLYWIYHDRVNLGKLDDKKEFVITKENYFLFQLFDTLYHDIKNYQIFVEDDFRTLDEVNQLNDSFKKYHYYEYHLLFQDNKVIWYSDDYAMDEASRFVLAPNDDYYILTFYKSKNYLFQSYGVRIRNSGSRYNHFNVPFMRMYHRLCEYDYESNYHQIHMEEYLFHKSKIKQKETI